jgi:hypothetical protein
MNISTKVIPIPNVDGYVMTMNGHIVSPTTFKCSMELHLAETESWVNDTWIGVNELDADGYVMDEYVWYFSPEAIQKVVG